MINFDIIYKSAKPLAGAIDGIAGHPQLAHIPGYGLIIASDKFCQDASDLEMFIDQAKSVLFGLVGLIQGLSERDMVALTVNVRMAGGPNQMAVVQMNQGNPASLKVYLDGQPR